MKGSNIYADESCQNNHRYMVLGGVIVEIDELQQIKKPLLEVRNTHKIYAEMKWEKVSKSKLPAYIDYVNCFFDQAASEVIHFHSITIDMHQIKHNKYNFGDRELGFQKFYYQLLIKFGRYYNGSSPYYCYLHQRNTKSSLDSFRDILNNGISSRWGINDQPYRRVQHICSKKIELLQLNDILLGCVAARTNGHHLKRDASPHKIKLGEHIMEKAGIDDLSQDTEKGKYRFSIWNLTLSN